MNIWHDLPEKYISEDNFTAVIEIPKERVEFDDAVKMINECGANRLGTSSGVAIMEGATADKNSY